MPFIRTTSASLLVLALAACGGADAPDTPASTETAPAATEATPATTETAPAETEKASAEESVIDRLQGEWASVDDLQAGMLVEGDQAAITYEGQDIEMVPLAVVDTCPDAPAVDGLTLIEIGAGDDALCYSVNDVTDSTLELTYLARGNLLRYIRPVHD